MLANYRDKNFSSNAITHSFQNAVVPFASMCGCVNRTSHPCGSSENGVAVFAQVALLLQKHLSTALRPIDGQICG